MNENDYYDDTIKRIDAMINRAIARREALCSEIKDEIKAINLSLDRLNNLFSPISPALNELKENQSDTLTSWGIIVVLVVGILQLSLTLLLK